MERSNNGLSIVSGVVSLLAALALVVFLLDPFVGRYLWAALCGGAIGALIGFIAGRAGANTWNRVGLWLGLLTALASIALVIYLTPGEVEIIEVTEESGTPTPQQ